MQFNGFVGDSEVITILYYSYWFVAHFHHLTSDFFKNSFVFTAPSSCSCILS